MLLTDTHCHIHSTDYDGGEAAYQRAQERGITRLLCVGTDRADSELAVQFATSHNGCWASLGIHPHEAKTADLTLVAFKEMLVSERAMGDVRRDSTQKSSETSEIFRGGPNSRTHLQKTSHAAPKIVALGECGLDYYYNHSRRDQQHELLHAHLKLASEYNLPLIFHVREAFDDFWPIFDQYPGITGVLHKLTDSAENLQQGLARGLYIGVNGIATFNKDLKLTEVHRAIPLEKLLLETDTPYLTPTPLRGKVNEPAFITHVAQFMADLRSISLEELSAATQANATTLFSLT